MNLLYLWVVWSGSQERVVQEVVNVQGVVNDSTVENRNIVVQAYATMVSVSGPFLSLCLFSINMNEFF